LNIDSALLYYLLTSFVQLLMFVLSGFFFSLTHLPTGPRKVSRSKTPGSEQWERWPMEIREMVREGEIGDTGRGGGGMDGVQMLIM
jgi:hypothetical protein